MLRSFVLLSALTLAGCASGEADAPGTEPLAPEAAPSDASAATGENADAPEAPTSDHGSGLLAGPTIYSCPDGESFTVAPVGGGAIEVTLEGDTDTLQPQVGKQGVYGGGPLEVWVSAEGAFVIKNGKFTLTDCSVGTNT